MAKSIKLNLGCGNKIEKDWINVDQSEKADIKADLLDLPFDDDFADEIKAIHVIEHFYQWQIQDVLKEWRRVLKPGGLIALECPDIGKVCMFTIRTLMGEPIPVNYTMYGLYGDFTLKDPYMCHKWGFIPETLSAEMRNAGFKNIKEKPAKYHIKERDLRLEGYK